MDSSCTIEQKRDHYHKEIARRTPPRNCDDGYMLNVYQGLLDEIDWFLMNGGSPRAEVPEMIKDSEERSPH